MAGEKRFNIMKMNKAIMTAAFTLASMFAHAQGLVYFLSDYAIVLPNANGSPGDLATGTLADAPYQAELAVNGILYTNSINPMDRGYFNGPGRGIIVIAGLPGGTVVNYQVYIWNAGDGATYAEAAAKPGAIVGTSGLVTGYVLGTDGGDPPGFPPAPLFFAPFLLWVAWAPLTVSQDSSTSALVFSWPAPIPSVGLEQISDLTRTNWTAVTNIVITTNRLNQTTVPFSSSSMFYRLKIP